MINSQSTRTLRLPHGDGTAQPFRRLPLYSEGVILISAVFNQIVQMQKSNNTGKQISKNSKCAAVEYIIYRKEKSNKNRS